MAGWDEGSVTYSDSINGGVERDDLRSTARDAFLSFFREFRDGPIFIYRCAAPSVAPSARCLRRHSVASLRCLAVPRGPAEQISCGKAFFCATAARCAWTSHAR